MLRRLHIYTVNIANSRKTKKYLKGIKTRAKLCLSPGSVSIISNHSPSRGDGGTGPIMPQHMGLKWCTFLSNCYVHDIAREWPLCSCITLLPTKVPGMGHSPGNHYLKQFLECVLCFGVGFTCNLFLGSHVSL